MEEHQKDSTIIGIHNPTGQHSEKQSGVQEDFTFTTNQLPTGAGTSTANWNLQLMKFGSSDLARKVKGSKFILFRKKGAIEFVK